MTHLLPPNGRANSIYTPSQQSPDHTAGSPLPMAKQGSRIVLRYQENGHVTLPHNRPDKPSPGLIFVCGTNQSSPADIILGIHKVWNKEGTGGDHRGRLLAVQSFDDGRCYSPTASPMSFSRFPPDPQQGKNRWCRNVTTPPQETVGRYTFYWGLRRAERGKGGESGHLHDIYRRGCLPS